VATRAFLKGATLANGMSERAMEEVNLVRTGAVTVIGAPAGFIRLGGLAMPSGARRKQDDDDPDPSDDDFDDEGDDDDDDSDPDKRRECSKCHMMNRPTARACKACGGRSFKPGVAATSSSSLNRGVARSSVDLPPEAMRQVESAVANFYGDSAAKVRLRQKLIAAHHLENSRSSQARPAAGTGAADGLPDVVLDQIEQAIAATSNGRTAPQIQAVRERMIAAHREAGHL
jgi:hypothetical protein